MKSILITVGSITKAIKAKNILLRSGIHAKLTKLDGNLSVGGCTHGIQILESELYSAAKALRQANINYKVK